MRARKRDNNAKTFVNINEIRQEGYKKTGRKENCEKQESHDETFIVQSLLMGLNGVHSYFHLNVFLFFFNHSNIFISL